MLTKDLVDGPALIGSHYAIARIDDVPAAFEWATKQADANRAASEERAAAKAALAGDVIENDGDGDAKA